MSQSLRPALPLDRGPTAEAPVSALRTRKVLHVIPGLAGGGAERALRNLARTMQGSGWETVILVFNVGPHQSLADDLRSLGCTVHDLAQPALLHPAVWFGTWKTMLREQPDVVQTWMHHADFIGAVAALFAGVKNVIWGIRASVVWRNPEDSVLKTRLFHSALNHASRWLPSRIIGNSHKALEAHAAMGYPRQKFAFVANGIDAERFSSQPGVRAATRSQWQIRESAIVVGFVGRFHPLKEIPLFFRVVAELQATQPELHLVLCGGLESELYPEAREAWMALPKPEQVRFVPFSHEAEKVYPGFDLLLMCSGEAEAFPNVVLEAMACETPVVATSAGDAPIIVGDAGRLVPVGDQAALVRACMETLDQSAADLAAQKARGRQRAVEEYNLARNARRFIDIYEEVVRA